MSARWPRTRRRWRSCSCASTARRCTHERHASASSTDDTAARGEPAAAPTGFGHVVGDRRQHLLRLILRLDRLRLPLWLVGLGGTIVASALAVPPLYDTPEKVAGYARALGVSPVNYLMSGRQVGLDTLGGIVANEISQVAQLGICLMVMFLVVRHTRAEEESGRAELLRSTVVGRHAATLAGLLYGFAPALLIGAITTASMIAAGLAVDGSITYGTGTHAPRSRLHGRHARCRADLHLRTRCARPGRRRGRGRVPRTWGRGDGGQRPGVGLTVRVGPAHGRVR